MASVPLDIKQKHNKLLVDLCDLIDINSLSYKNFIGFLHNAALPAGRLQRVKDEPMDVFHLMEERGILKEGDYIALEEALCASGHKQALNLVKKSGSEITKQIVGQVSTLIGIQETIAVDDDYPSYKKRKTGIQETSSAEDNSPSNKKTKIGDDDCYIEETDFTAGSKVVSQNSLSTLINERTSHSIQVVAPTPQTSLIGQFTSHCIPTQPVQQISIDRSELTPIAFGESQGQDGKIVDLQNEDEVLDAIVNNIMKVEDMIENNKIPQLSTIRAAVKKAGYCNGVQLTLREMSKLLSKEIPHATGVWCGYDQTDPHTPVFVVTLKNQKCILKKNEIPELFIGYSIVFKYKYLPNDEEKRIVEHYGSKCVRSEDIACLNNLIATHTENLMMEHSNLSIIRPCPVKSTGYLKNQMDVIEKSCIVFYVPVKGIIPVGEKEFPRDIDGIVTDVREGEFCFLGGHNAMEYHQKLRMGCCIKRSITGSLGGFVELPNEKVGCLTAAHVVLAEDQIKSYFDMVEEDRKKLNDSLAQGNSPIEIHQPAPCPGVKPFGRVQAIALDAGNSFAPSVDAAIIEITDDERKPEMGNFPDGDFENIGFTKEEPMLYTRGDILDDIDFRQKGSLVIKFGCTTGITQGYIEWIGESVREVDTWGSYSFPIMMGQLEVHAYNFAAPGDSGAVVFLCLGGNIRNLHAVGMIIGGSSTGCQCFITPINAVFERLGLINNRFKVFPPRQLPRHKTTSQNVST